jgi:hypothetical protein
LSDFDDSWRDFDHTPAVDRWIMRSAERRDAPEEPEPERADPRGRPMDADELAAFKAQGRRINYCGERLAKQKLNEARAARRRDLRPLGGGKDLIDLVINAIAHSDRPAEMLGESRVIIRRIMIEHRNRRYKRTSGMSAMHRRHQQNVRLVHAMAAGMTLAQYYKKIGISPKKASRSLARIAEKEPGLVEALKARSACAAMTSLQEVTKKKLLRLKERERKEIELSYGVNDFQNIVAEPYPSQASSGRMSKSGGGRQPLALIEQPWWVFDHVLGGEPREPDEWWLYEFIAAVFDLPRNHRIPVPAPYRHHKPLSRAVVLKDGRRASWAVVRAVPVEAWTYQQYDPDPDDAAWLCWASRKRVLEPPRPPRPSILVMDGAIHVVKYVKPNGLPAYRGYPITDCCGQAPGSIRIGWNNRLSEAEWTAAPMCQPTRWVELPKPRAPHGLIEPYSRRDWMPVLAKDYEHYQAKEFEVPDVKRTIGVRIFLISSKPQTPEAT